MLLEWVGIWVIELVLYFFFVLGDVDWKTLEAAIKFSMYWPRTWFSDFSFKFSSLTLSTRCERYVNIKEWITIWKKFMKFMCFTILIPSKVFWSSITWAIKRAFSSCSSKLMSSNNGKIWNSINETFLWLLAVIYSYTPPSWSELSFVKREDMESRLGTLPTLDSSASSGKTAMKNIYINVKLNACGLNKISVILNSYPEGLRRPVECYLSLLG